MSPSKIWSNKQQTQHILPHFQNLLFAPFMAPGDHLSEIHIEHPEDLRREVKCYCFQRILRGEGEDMEHTVPLALMFWYPFTKDQVQPDIQKIMQSTIAKEFEEYAAMYAICGFANGGYKIPFVIGHGGLIKFGSYIIDTDLCPAYSFLLTPRSFGDRLEGLDFEPIWTDSRFCIYSRQSSSPTCPLFWPECNGEEIDKILQKLKSSMVSFGEALHARYELLLLFNMSGSAPSPNSGGVISDIGGRV